jgi:hypothetical protein
MKKTVIGVMGFMGVKLSTTKSLKNLSDEIQIHFSQEYVIEGLKY